MATKQITVIAAPPGIQHALTEAQRQMLWALHGRLQRLLQEVPPTDIQKLRSYGLNLTQTTIDIIMDVDNVFGFMKREYRDRIFFYGVQGLRRVAAAVQQHFGVDIPFTRWTPHVGPRPRPPDDCTVKDRWRWAIQWNLDMTSNMTICLGAASGVLKDCTLSGPTRVTFQSEEDYPCPEVEEYDQAWKDELRGYAGCALYALAHLLSARFAAREKGWREVVVLGFSTRGDLGGRVDNARVESEVSGLARAGQEQRVQEEAPGLSQQDSAE
ncbi:hypothetical protein PRZ48_009755 [Zasmidium cellare]|uniref:Uncharacterized protein n=1 Tax=Zasmidium cellare TaxID=395010 RepID=A0ABR0ECP0_ZASCE|nr:hypothetical protein PRZ48_009755 [Zasmidium cellare]